MYLKFSYSFKVYASLYQFKRHLQIISEDYIHNNVRKTQLYFFKLQITRINLRSVSNTFCHVEVLPLEFCQWFKPDTCDKLLTILMKLKSNTFIPLVVLDSFMLQHLLSIYLSGLCSALGKQKWIMLSLHTSFTQFINQQGKDCQWCSSDSCCPERSGCKRCKSTKMLGSSGFTEQVTPVWHQLCYCEWDNKSKAFTCKKSIVSKGFEVRHCPALSRHIKQHVWGYS
jgi:hypothetical protein